MDSSATITQVAMTSAGFSRQNGSHEEGAIRGEAQSHAVGLEGNLAVYDFDYDGVPDWTEAGDAHVIMLQPEYVPVFFPLQPRTGTQYVLISRSVAVPAQLLGNEVPRR